MEVVSSRKEQKAEARERRLAAERARQEAAHERRVHLLAAATAAIAIAAVGIVIALATGGSGSEPSPAGAAKPPAESPLAGIRQRGAFLGSPRAPVVLTEFADLQCPYCRDYATQILPQLLDEYVRTGKVRLELRLLRFIGPDSDRGARAAYEAAQRNRMWNFVDGFFRNQGAEGTGYADDGFIEDLAGEAGIPASALLGAIENSRHEDAIAASEAAAEAAGIDSTPSFLIKTKDGGTQPLEVQQLTPEVFREAIDAAL